jgi:ABC-2 type transport system permease protein
VITRPKNVWAAVWLQIRYQTTLFRRTPVAAFFTILLPVMFLVLFNLLFGDAEVNGVPFSQFFTPAIGVFAAISASFTNLAINTAMSRDNGILKRVRGTPLSPWIYMAGRIGSAVVIAVFSIAIMFFLGWLLYEFDVTWARVHEAALVFVVGLATFSAMGLAVAALVKSSDSVPAVANAVILPMAFVSDVFIQTEDAPTWLQRVGDFFPMKHFVRLFSDAFNPFVTGSVFGWGGMAVMIAWGVLALLVTTRAFSWEPR